MVLLGDSLLPTTVLHSLVQLVGLLETSVHQFSQETLQLAEVELQGVSHHLESLLLLPVQLPPHPENPLLLPALLCHASLQLGQSVFVDAEELFALV